MPQARWRRRSRSARRAAKAAAACRRSRRSTRARSAIKSSLSDRGPGSALAGGREERAPRRQKQRLRERRRRSGGSKACSRIEAAPTRNPPSAAPERLPRPPITVPTKAMITSCTPMRGCTTPVCTTIRQETAAARTPLSAKAMAITLLARTPNTRAMRKSSAAARMCKPSRVALAGTRSRQQAAPR